MKVRDAILVILIESLYPIMPEVDVLVEFVVHS